MADEMTKVYVKLDPFPYSGPMNKWLAWIQNQFAKVPMDHRESATLEILAEDSYLDVELSYWQQETEPERQKRKKQELDDADRAEQYAKKLREKWNKDEAAKL